MSFRWFFPAAAPDPAELDDLPSFIRRDPEAEDVTSPVST